MNHRPIASFSLWSLLLACSGTGLCAERLQGEWRVFRAQVAPWIDATAVASAAALPLGERIHFGDAIHGPGPLNCSEATARPLVVTVEGLFQGGLPQPAADAANLGFAPGEVQTWRVDCANSSWDFHVADEHTLLFALDHRIYSLSRAAGALASADSPAGRVQVLLEHHFAGDMGFSPEAWAPLQPYVSAVLRARIDAYASADWPSDEVPPIDGDPLTDSQEHPHRFAVGPALLEDDSAEVEVRFADAYRERRVVYLLQRQSGEWQLHDLRYEDGSLFSAALAERPW
jgi:hypothetical protein